MDEQKTPIAKCNQIYYKSREANILLVLIRTSFALNAALVLCCISAIAFTIRSFHSGVATHSTYSNGATLQETPYERVFHVDA